MMRVGPNMGKYYGVWKIGFGATFGVVNGVESDNKLEGNVGIIEEYTIITKGKCWEVGGFSEGGSRGLGL